MAPRRLSHFGLLAGLWTLPLVYWSVQGYIHSQRAGKPMSIGDVLIVEVVYCYLWVGLTPLIYSLGHRFRLERSTWKRYVPLHALFATLLSAGQRITWLLIARQLSAGYRKMPFSEQIIPNLWMIDYGFGIYWLTLLLSHSLDYYNRYREGEEKRDRLQAQLALAQLKALQMQLQPHFLFNTLHAISALVQEDPEAAERMIARLSELLRLSLDTSSDQILPLSKELDFLRRYLEIEQMRFEDRLTVRFDVTSETLDAEVPNLILQPLVENAIRHGVSRRTDTGVVQIRARRKDGLLKLQVVDNGAGLQGIGLPLREGVGLSTTRARLECLYGNDHRLEFTQSAEGGIEATLTFPFRPVRTLQHA
ncbi:MAG: sensor histidine kinase [Bryobacteraceae bacterium]